MLKIEDVKQYPIKLDGVNVYLMSTKTGITICLMLIGKNLIGKFMVNLNKALF